MFFDRLLIHRKKAAKEKILRVLCIDDSIAMLKTMQYSIMVCKNGIE